jgi:nitrite reductase/ring-hydroxylating ferredoxin subunit
MGLRGLGAMNHSTLNFFELCATDDLWIGEMEVFDVGAHEVLLVNIDGEFHAYDGVCPHQGMPLIEGQLVGKVLTCRAHQWSFDACSGGGINPSGACLRRFPLRIENGSVWVADQPGDE